MILNHLSIINYRNLTQVELDLSPKLNGITGLNGMGKTNLIDTIYNLAFCKSATNLVDSQNIRHGEDFYMIQGVFTSDDGTPENIYCGVKRNHRKQFKRNKKEYERLSEHIGFIPLVMVSPADIDLINATSDVRRRFMDMVISQYDRTYLDALIRYGKALNQRNTLLRAEHEPDEELLALWEYHLCQEGQLLFEKRQTFIQLFIPLFQRMYDAISPENEHVHVQYISHLQQGDFAGQIRRARPQERILGYTTKGIHRDDLIMKLGDYAIRHEGSQGQNKTFLIALKLAQFLCLKKYGSGTTPLLLLDDIFDKLDATRVQRIIKVVSGDEFGQIFITDTNRERMEYVLNAVDKPFKVFEVEFGKATEIKTQVI